MRVQRPDHGSRAEATVTAGRRAFEDQLEASEEPLAAGDRLHVRQLLDRVEEPELADRFGKGVTLLRGDQHVIDGSGRPAGEVGPAQRPSSLSKHGGQPLDEREEIACRRSGRARHPALGGPSGVRCKPRPPLTKTADDAGRPGAAIHTPDGKGRSRYGGSVVHE